MISVITGKLKSSRRGFAGMDKTKQREIARKGGVNAHKLGVAHKWTSEEAKLAGQKSRRGAKHED